MENREHQDNRLSIDKDAQIQVVVNSPAYEGEEIDLAKVFHRMKLKWRIFAWVLVLCLTIGATVPLVVYQFTRPMLKVSSVVKLDYMVPYNDEDADSEMRQDNMGPNNDEDADSGMRQVSDLTAPDGRPLDLNQITSSYVLQNALNGLKLSQPITVEALRGKITVERILTEESRRKQEVIANMVQDKNSGAYEAVQGLDLFYENTFVVSLENGFGEGRRKIELKDIELRQVLDRVLTAYNDYLVMTYADTRLPDDEISAIETESIDILDCLDQLRTALRNLNSYCEEKSDQIKAYRSWRTGRSLNDWIETMNTVREVNVEYLYSYVYTNSIVRNRDTMITSYQYQLRDAQSQLDVVNENIETVKSILDQYKNDEIYVSMQESDSEKTTKTTTDYYNTLIMNQAESYEQAETLETRIMDLQDKIASLNNAANVETSNIEEAEAELANAISASHEVYYDIVDHMSELMSQPMYTTYADHSAALGQTENFLVASMKNIGIGLALGAALALGLWFLSGLAPEFAVRDEAEDPKKRKRIPAVSGERGA